MCIVLTMLCLVSGLQGATLTDTGHQADVYVTLDDEVEEHGEAESFEDDKPAIEEAQGTPSSIYQGLGYAGGGILLGCMVLESLDRWLAKRNFFQTKVLCDDPDSFNKTLLKYREALHLYCRSTLGQTVPLLFMSLNFAGSSAQPGEYMTSQEQEQLKPALAIFFNTTVTQVKDKIATDFDFEGPVIADDKKWCEELTESLFSGHQAKNLKDFYDLIKVEASKSQPIGNSSPLTLYQAADICSHFDREMDAINAQASTPYYQSYEEIYLTHNSDDAVKTLKYLAQRQKTQEDDFFQEQRVDKGMVDRSFKRNAAAIHFWFFQKFIIPYLWHEALAKEGNTAHRYQEMLATQQRVNDYWSIERRAHALHNIATLLDVENVALQEVKRKDVVARSFAGNYGSALEAPSDGNMLFYRSMNYEQVDGAHPPKAILDGMPVDKKKNRRGERLSTVMLNGPSDILITGSGHADSKGASNDTHLIPALEAYNTYCVRTRHRKHLIIGVDTNTTEAKENKDKYYIGTLESKLKEIGYSVMSPGITTKKMRALNTRQLLKCFKKAVDPSDVIIVDSLHAHNYKVIKLPFAGEGSLFFADHDAVLLLDVRTIKPWAPYLPRLAYIRSCCFGSASTGWS